MKTLIADFETTSELQAKAEHKTKVYLYCVMDIDKTFVKYGVNIYEFFNDLFNMEEDITVYFHNLSFDGEFILWYLLENCFNARYVKEKELLNNEFTHLSTDTGDIYSITVNHNNNFIYFKCSLKLLPVSIKDLGKLVGEDKLDEQFDYNCFRDYTDISQVPAKDIEYIHNDVDIARRALLVAFENGIDKLTLASSSYKNWSKREYTKNRLDLKQIENQEFNDIIDLSYHGGISYLNPVHKGKLLYKFVSYDVNSLYPATMLNNSMPVGIPKLVKERDVNKKKKHLYYVFINYAKIKDGYHPFIPTKNNRYGSYDYGTELVNFTVALWEDEFTLFKACYLSTYVVLKILEFNVRENMFKDYMEFWKNIKETTDNPVLKKIAKLMLNSLYGKFGTNIEKVSKQITSYDETIHYNLVANESKYYYRPIASYITSMARCTLIKAIEDNRHRFIYCDTDSVYLLGDEKPNLNIDDRIFGYWKDECKKVGGYYARGLFLKSKCYIKEYLDGSISPTCAGLPKKAQKLLNFDNFKDGLVLKNAKLQKCKFKGGVILKEVDFTINIK